MTPHHFGDNEFDPLFHIPHSTLQMVKVTEATMGSQNATIAVNAFERPTQSTPQTTTYQIPSQVTPQVAASQRPSQHTPQTATNSS
ncbi:hypothetical protein Tco_0991555 [Tanacetum coccineum]|uniref:Uncharacterized protein n=1 Tax=Tanacetum coccineum TaxID=301880 RepID=A0ABQ5EZK1_9ASTR